MPQQIFLGHVAENKVDWTADELRKVVLRHFANAQDINGNHYPVDVPVDYGKHEGITRILYGKIVRAGSDNKFAVIRITIESIPETNPHYRYSIDFEVTWETLANCLNTNSPVIY